MEARPVEKDFFGLSNTFRQDTVSLFEIVLNSEPTLTLDNREIVEASFIPLASQSNIGFRTHYPIRAGLCLHTDPGLLRSVMINLVTNAIKYSPNGGDITVHACVDGSEILVGVEDQGLGIPADHLSKVFERFHRVHNEDNRKIYGTGLGLYLVKHLVEEHGVAAQGLGVVMQAYLRDSEAVVDELLPVVSMASAGGHGELRISGVCA